jgi:hypothetical protein
MKEVDARARLQEFRNQFQTQREAAEALGVGTVFLGDMLAGRREVSARTKEFLGLRTVTVEAK